jgi:hypothetical protein
LGPALDANHSAINPKTAVDPELGGQLRDLPEVSTAARFTEWVTTAIAANICG